MSDQINTDDYKKFLEATALLRSLGYETAAIGQIDTLRARIAELEERIDVAEGMSYKRSLHIAELEAALKGLNIAIANDMRHADDVSGTGWDTLKELSDAMSEANRLTQTAAPEVDNAR